MYSGDARSTKYQKAASLRKAAEGCQKLDGMFAAMKKKKQEDELLMDNDDIYNADQEDLTLDPYPEHTLDMLDFCLSQMNDIGLHELENAVVIEDDELEVSSLINHILMKIYRCVGQRLQNTKQVLWTSKNLMPPGAPSLLP